MGCCLTALVSATAFALGGCFNPIRILGGFLVAEESNIEQIPLCAMPFLGAGLGQLFYKYFLATEDIKELFKEDEEQLGG
jgi:hypothetical protein